MGIDFFRRSVALAARYLQPGQRAAHSDQAAPSGSVLPERREAVNVSLAAGLTSEDAVSRVLVFLATTLGADDVALANRGAEPRSLYIDVDACSCNDSCTCGSGRGRRCHGAPNAATT